MSFLNDRLGELLIAYTGRRFQAFTVSAAIQGLFSATSPSPTPTRGPGAIHEPVADLVGRYRAEHDARTPASCSARPHQELPMDLFLTGLSGLAWTIVYLAAIRVAFRDKTYAIPIAALGLNIAWEWIYAIYDLSSAPGAQAYINLVWALADVVIVYTFFRYGRAELPEFVTRPIFVAWGVAILATAVSVQLLFIHEFGLVDMHAAEYSAFLQNLLMSGLFIAMFVARRGPRGQSLVIGVAKWIGTLAPTILFGVIDGSTFALGLGILCSAFDLAYIGILLWAHQNLALLSHDRTGPAGLR